MTSLHPAVQVAVAVVTLVAAFTDLKWRIIPNWLIVAGLIGGFVLNAAIGGWGGIWNSVLGFGLALCVYVPLFILRAMGGGDVKLMAVVGCIIGPHNWFILFILASIAGGIYAAILLFARDVGGGVLWNMVHILRELVRLRLPYKSRPALDVGHAKALSVPHAVAIFAGAITFLYNF